KPLLYMGTDKTSKKIHYPKLKHIVKA
ncbi:unnamed protein product, partial [Rotaria sordida]